MEVKFQQQIYKPFSKGKRIFRDENMIWVYSTCWQKCMSFDHFERNNTNFVFDFFFFFGNKIKIFIWVSFEDSCRWKVDLNSMTSLHSKWQFSSVSSEILFDEKYNQIVQEESDLFYSDLILEIVFRYKLCETL